MTDMELKELCHLAILEGDEFEKLCNKLLLALYDGNVHPNVDELNDVYDSKNVIRAFNKLCERDLLKSDVISAQVTMYGGCYITIQGNNIPFTEKAEELISQLQSN